MNKNHSRNNLHPPPVRPAYRCRRMLTALPAALLMMIACTLFIHANAKKDNNYTKQYRTILVQMDGLYDVGQLEQVIELYEIRCHNIKTDKTAKGFKKANKEVRSEIYRLAFLSYTAVGKPEESEAVLRKFLAIRHHEKMDKFVWVSIRKAAQEKYIVAPRFLFGLNLGVNFSFIDPGIRHNIIEPVNSIYENEYRKKYPFHFNRSRGTQYGLHLQYAWTKHLSLTVLPSISTMKFRYKNKILRIRKQYDPYALPTLEDEEDLKINYNHHQQLHYLEVPVLLNYRWLKGKFEPYVQVGAYYGLLMSATKSIHAESSPEDDYKEDIIKNIEAQLNRSNIGIWIGGGVAYELGRSGIRVQAEINYKHGLNNLVSKDSRFINEELMYAYYDIFDDMKIRNLSVTVKLVLPLSYKAFKR